jgi:hypothetical protein
MPLEAWDSAPFFLSVGPRVVVFHEPPGSEGATRLQRRLMDEGFTVLPLSSRQGGAVAYLNLSLGGAPAPCVRSDGDLADMAPQP